jgi:nitric oxide reductase large subunit
MTGSADKAPNHKSRTHNKPQAWAEGAFLSLLPQGLRQTYASYTHDYAYARAAEFIHSPVMQTLVWARVPGDVVFGIGALAFAVFMALAFLHRRNEYLTDGRANTVSQ